MTQKTSIDYLVTFEKVSIVKVKSLTNDRRNRLCPFSTEGSNTVQHVKLSNGPAGSTTCIELLQVHWSRDYADSI
jgi:hypothetical protein